VRRVEVPVHDVRQDRRVVDHAAVALARQHERQSAVVQLDASDSAVRAPDHVQDASGFQGLAVQSGADGAGIGEQRPVRQRSPAALFAECAPGRRLEEVGLALRQQLENAGKALKHLHHARRSTPAVEQRQLLRDGMRSEEELHGVVGPLVRRAEQHDPVSVLLLERLPRTRAAADQVAHNHSARAVREQPHGL
jgi:hypothetical protein